MVNHLNQEPCSIYNQRKKGFSFREITRVLRSWRYRFKKSFSDQTHNVVDTPPCQGNGDEKEDRGNLPRLRVRTSNNYRRTMDACFSRQDSSSPIKRSSSPSPSTSPDPDPIPNPDPRPSFMHKQASMRSTRGRNGLPESMSRCSSHMNGRNGLPESLSRCSSRMNSNPIMFSNSTGVVKPPPIERQLECTLEELCFGCTKKIKVTRDMITESGQRIEQEEMLSINVNPGWRKGTKITFEGMGNELPRSYTADINFVITEKQHPIFQRDGDDLELTMEIPLVKALTACSLPIPLLSGDEIELDIDEIIHPGYEKTITGQGMPDIEGSRGNLKVIFQVNFPKELTDEQRAAAVSILGDSCS